MPRTDQFERALTATISLLRGLPRARGQVAEARARFAEYAKAHADLRTDFVVDLEPGREHASYDILLDHPDGGTVAVSWNPDHASPWLADYAEHWAANYVVTVGDARLTVQDALTSLRVLGGDDAGLFDRLVDETIIRKAVIDHRVDTTLEEVRQAMDETRRMLGLYSAAATREWLARMGWSTHQFESLVAGGVRVRKLRDLIVADRIDAHFEAHPEWFDVVRVCAVETRRQEIAERLVSEAAGTSLVDIAQRLSAPEMTDVVVTIKSVRSIDLPVELRDLPAGAVGGPTRVRDGFAVHQVQHRERAELDARTRAAVGDALFRDWLAEQRRQAPVQWHWL